MIIINNYSSPVSYKNQHLLISFSIVDNIENINRISINSRLLMTLSDSNYSTFKICTRILLPYHNYKFLVFSSIKKAKNFIRTYLIPYSFKNDVVEDENELKININDNIYSFKIYKTNQNNFNNYLIINNKILNYIEEYGINKDELFIPFRLN